MYQFSLEIHSILRYVILISLVILIVKNLFGWLKPTTFQKFDNLLSTFTVSTTHLQLITGLILYFMSPLVVFKGEIMENDVLRYYTIEHILLMSIAIAMFTIGRVKLKKKENHMIKHRVSFIYNIAGLAVIILTLGMSHRGII